MLATGVHSYPSVCHLFSFHFLVISNQHQPIHEAQIYFIFLSVGNPKTVLKGGYVGWKGGSSFASLWFERWLVWTCKCAYDCGLAICHFAFNVNITSLKLARPAPKFSIISSANSSGSGRLSRSASDLSLSQEMSKLVLSLAMISS
jgi:hypothetical protein